MSDREDPFVLDVHVEDRGIDDVVNDGRQRRCYRGRRQDHLAAAGGEELREIRREYHIVFDDQDRSVFQ
jgi:hypothetical protein